MQDTFAKLQSGLANAARALAAPPGKHYVPLDPDVAPLDSQILVDDGLDEAGLDAARREFVLGQWAERDTWTGKAMPSPSAAQPHLPVVFLCIGVLVFFLSLGSVILWGGMAWLFGGFLMAFSIVWSVLSLMILLRQRKFIPGELRLAAAPVALGDRIRGTLRTGVSHALHPGGDFTLRLCCIESIRSSGEGGRVSSTQKTVWSSETTCKGFLALGDRHYSLEFDLPVPDDQMPWTFGTGARGFSWSLVITANMQGLDYAESFPLPILSPRDYGYVCGAR